MKLVDLVVLPEKKPIKSCGDCEYKHRMLEHGCNCSEAMDNLGFNLVIDIISKIEIPIAKILELVEVDVEKVEELFKKNISTYHYSEVLKFKKDLGSNKKDILKAVKS